MIKIKDKDYSKLRTTSIILSTIMLPISTFVGFQFGSKNYRFAIFALVVQCVVTFIQAHIWWLTLEKSGRD